MDPEELRQWLASIDSYGQPLPEVEPFRRLPGMPTSPDPTRFFAQQDATAPQTRERPRSFIEMLRNAGEAFGANTLGRALTLGTTDPRLPETQQAYRTALGLGADLTPVIGAGKASFIDAPELFKEGRPIAGALTFGSGAIGPAMGLPRAFARLMKPLTRVAPEALGAAAEAAPTIVKAKHYGAGARAEKLLVGRRGSGRPGTESVNDAQQPRTYFYLPEVLEAQTGRPFRPEPQFAGDPSVELDLDIGNFVNTEGQTQYQDRARDILRARKAAGPNPNINPEPMWMDVQNLSEEMMIADGAEGVMDETRGIAAKFSDTPLPSGATGNGVRRVASQATEYVARSGRPGLDAHPEKFEYLPLPEDEGREIADVYDQLPHAPNDPAVRESYRAMADETKEQYLFLQEKGVEFRPAVDDPYATSADMIADVRDNNRLEFFLTDMDDFPADHPLGEKTGIFMELADGTQQEMVYNDLFRAVHDYFGHASEGFQFGPRGEHNAWGLHSAMYSPKARGAMSFETRGQNSWVNFGQQLRRADGTLPQRGEADFVPPGERRFPDQKANILPERFTDVTPGSRTPMFGQGSQSPLQYLGDLGAPTDLPPRETARVAAGARLRRDNRSVASRARRVQAIEGGLTPEELERYQGLNSRTRTAVEENYSRLPEPEVFAQAAIRGAESRGWYLGSGRAIRESFGEEAPRFTALLAAMSPQKSVEENLKIALNTWGDWNAAGRPTDEAALRLAIDSNLEADIGNAMRALRAADDDVAAGIPELLNGPKVGPFYANLVGVVDPVVNDTHMARGYGTLPGGVGTVGRTIAQNAMVRNAAVEFERLTGQAVDPRELQEMSWAYIRGLTNAAGNNGSALETIEAAILKPETAFAGGQALDDRVRNSVSIGHLMAQPEFAPALQRAGIGAPTPHAPTGTPGVDPLSADPNALRDIAERIDLVRKGTPLYELAALLGGGAAVRSQQRRERR